LLLNALALFTTKSTIMIHLLFYFKLTRKENERARIALETAKKRHLDKMTRLKVSLPAEQKNWR
jgi:hypothetical protein